MKTNSKSSRPRLRKGTVTRYLEGSGIVAVFELPVIYAPESPGEALLEAKTIKFLDRATARVKSGDVAWLKKNGARVFVDSPAA